ncbi:MAG: hypothetical protein QOF30_3641 [Acidimicrobiaceae bacterium]|nr:hypothetical protein [Acidimicrobiaceae bacterium]
MKVARISHRAVRRPSENPSEEKYDGDVAVDRATPGLREGLRLISCSSASHGDQSTDCVQKMDDLVDTRWANGSETVVKSWIIGLGAGTSLLILTSCGSAARSTKPAAATVSVAPPVGSGWLMSSTTSVEFIQWTDNAGVLTGTAQAATKNDQGRTLAVATGTYPLVGSLHGSTLSISFDGRPATFGTVSGDSFTLNVPQQDGTLAPVTFHKAPTSAFNAAVANLNTMVSDANQQAAAAQAQADQEASNAHAQQVAQNKVDGDVSAVNSAIAALPQQESALSTTLQHIASGSLHAVVVAVAGVHSQEQMVIAEARQYPDGNAGGVCADAAGVAAAASGVEADVSGVAADASGVSNGLASLRSTISGLTQSFAQFQSDRSAGTSVPSGAPTNADVSKATTAANSALSSALSTINAYIDQANMDATTAYGYVVQAYKAGNCGDPSPQGNPENHVS